MNANFQQFAEGAFQPAYAPKRSGVKIWLIVAGAIGGALLLGLVVCGGLIYVGMAGVATREPTDAERQTLVTIRDLESFGVEAGRLEEREVWQSKRNLDGSLEIEYEYDPDLAPGPGEMISLMSSAEINSTESSARESFNMTIAAYQLGFGLYDVQSRDQSHAMAGVDQSRFALIVKNEKPVGNMIVVRQGKRVHGLLLIGLYFEDPQELEDLLRPTVERSEGIPLR